MADKEFIKMNVFWCTSPEGEMGIPFIVIDGQTVPMAYINDDSVDMFKAIAANMSKHTGLDFHFCTYKTPVSVEKIEPAVTATSISELIEKLQMTFDEPMVH